MGHSFDSGFPLIDPQPVIVMSNCHHNVEASFQARYLKETPTPHNINMELVLRIVDHLAKEMNIHYHSEFSLQEFIRAKPGATRRRYLKAYNQLLKDGPANLKKVSKIKAFVKNEKYYDDSKAPRMIMGRDPRFNIFYARFISRLEDSFFKLDQVANACDYAACGAKFKKLLGAWMFENDMSKFEATQRKFMLYLEYLVYSKVVGAKDVTQLRTLFATKMIKRGSALNMIEFLFMCCRGSGDMDTGLGNGILNYIATMYFKIMNFCPHKHLCQMNGMCCDFNGFVLKGDDSYGRMPIGKVPINYYSNFGFDAKLVVRQDPLKTEFCSGHFIRLANGDYYYVQSLRKLLTSLQVVINADVIRHGWLAHYYRSLGDMYSVLYKNIPYYEDVASFLQTASSKHRINIHLVNESYGAHEAFVNFERNVQKIDVCAQTYADISINNEFTFAELELLSKYCKTTKLQLPSEYTKRCNLRSRAPPESFTLQEDVVNCFDSALEPKAKTWFREMSKLQLSNTAEKVALLNQFMRDDTCWDNKACNC